MMSPLISPAELADLLADLSDRQAALVVLDATTILPGDGFDPDIAFHDAHVPGARRFDIEEFSDPETTLPHMVPTQGRFVRLIEALGVGNDTEIVFYDQTGVVSAARAWWLLGLFGHDRVRVLDGGLRRWREEGRPTETGVPAAPTPGHFVAAPRWSRLAGLGDVMAMSPAERAHLLDARSRDRFEARVPEPRAGLPGGSIPGTTSLPFGELLHDGYRFRPAADLKARFAEAGISAGNHVVTSCGSGLTASVLSLGLVLSGLGPGALYDGSWTEWARSGQPRRTGAMETDR